MATHRGNIFMFVPDKNSTGKNGFFRIAGSCGSSMSNMRTLPEINFASPSDPTLRPLLRLVLACSFFPSCEVIDSLMDPKSKHKLDLNQDRAMGVGLLPLEVAARRGHVEVVKCLVKHGARVDKGTPLLWAAYTGCDDVIDALVELGADPKTEVSKGLEDDACVPKGITPLDYAASNNQPSTVRLLVEKYGVVEGRPQALVNAVAMAKESGYKAIGEYLMGVGIGKGKEGENRCDRCAKPAKNRCSRCSTVYYCTRECQKAAWRLHKKDCTIKSS
eukprot:TRINITY_DN6916_c0_g1_i1.p1 TRINITY_DN6916_c0_g1~~TRINITY_DN6916_c0_g1_i1.p1  ORF type:complete len:319 (+),score=23.18 TRINITY_DN6916_c0_g1_i1:135-959(+)